ncbi:hypothetical protein CLV49_1773 [Labedella gwakjiensis]|uniref:Uncharacterized protein n=1 Tax=Labedella gwakjiensis TaxID=390269 RepID=A0A2P8GW25_9MICO|nr:hypothetical protein CLV49_1773 [Labedella gwakjiensis]
MRPGSGPSRRPGTMAEHPRASHRGDREATCAPRRLRSMMRKAGRMRRRNPRLHHARTVSRAVDSRSARIEGIQITTRLRVYEDSVDVRDLLSFVLPVMAHRPGTPDRASFHHGRLTGDSRRHRFRTTETETRRGDRTCQSERKTDRPICRLSPRNRTDSAVGTDRAGGDRLGRSRRCTEPELVRQRRCFPQLLRVLFVVGVCRRRDRGGHSHTDHDCKEECRHSFHGIPFWSPTGTSQHGRETTVGITTRSTDRLWMYSNLTKSNTRHSRAFDRHRRSVT